MDHTAADGVMIGRAAQGKPWLFEQINAYLEKGELLAEPDTKQRQAILQGHLSALHAFYGEFMGVQIARKHVGWYLKEQSNTDAFRKQFNGLESAEQQQQAIELFFEQQQDLEETAA